MRVDVPNYSDCCSLWHQEQEGSIAIQAAGRAGRDELTALRSSAFQLERGQHDGIYNVKMLVCADERYYLMIMIQLNGKLAVISVVMYVVKM